MILPTFKPVVLIVLDGVGIAQNGPGNAVKQANTPFLEKAWSSYPHTSLQASGKYVGLPEGVKGNSEVGHLNLGSGKIIYQDLPRINQSIDNGNFCSNVEFINAFRNAENNKSKLHVALCFSKGGVHSTIDHLISFLNCAKENDFNQPLIIHAFTDGRDSPPKSAAIYFNQIELIMHKIGIGQFGTIIGRYYAMDRNGQWDRTELAYKLLVNGKGELASNWKQAIENSYLKGKTDEFVPPTIIKNGDIDPTVKNGDSFVFLNYRADRAVQLTTAFVQPDFNRFNRGEFLNNLHFVAMTPYAKDIPKNIAFPKENVDIPLGRQLAEMGKRQLRIAESEKFPHVTYFFNGGRSIKFQGEDRIEIPSPDVATYDIQPEMSLFKVTKVITEKLQSNIYDFVLLNIANGDMVGHTGNVEAGKLAMEVVDRCTQKIVKAATAFGGCAILTADHGNIEEMINLDSKEVDTEHSDNPVPFIFIPPKNFIQTVTVSAGILADVSPTILKLMGLTKPTAMIRKSLI